MKKLTALLLATFVFATVPLATVASTPTAATAQHNQVLLVLVSKSADVRAMQQKGMYQLTLKGVNPNVVYFSERPVRVSGHITTEKMVSLWKTGVFQKAAPNAVVEAVGLNRNDQLKKSASTYAIVLNKPVYDEQTGELNFQVNALSGSNAILSLGDSDYVALFIDGVCYSCIIG